MQRPDDGTDPNRWRALWVTLVAGFMTLLDVTIVAVALPSMQRELHASAAAVQWVVSGYALAFALSLVTAGRIGDAFGRRRVFLAALAAFVLFSAAAGAAPGIGLLIVARLAQGVAAGCLAPQNSALIQQLFRGAERGRAFGLFGATVGVSSAVGPVVGGLILALAGPAGWRWIFYVNVPVGAVALLLGLRLLPRVEPGGRGRLDPVGVGLLGCGILALMLPLVLAEGGGLTRTWWLFPVGAVVLGAFARWERRIARRGGEPLLDPRLLTETRGYATGAGLAALYFVGFSGVWLVFALFFQNGLGYSPLMSGRRGPRRAARPLLPHPERDPRGLPGRRGPLGGVRCRRDAVRADRRGPRLAPGPARERGRRGLSAGDLPQPHPRRPELTRPAGADQRRLPNFRSICCAWARRRGSEAARRTWSAARRPCGLRANCLIRSSTPAMTFLRVDDTPASPSSYPALPRPPPARSACLRAPGTATRRGSTSQANAER